MQLKHLLLAPALFSATLAVPNVVSSAAELAARDSQTDCGLSCYWSIEKNAVCSLNTLTSSLPPVLIKNSASRMAVAHAQIPVLQSELRVLVLPPPLLTPVTRVATDVLFTPAR